MKGFKSNKLARKKGSASLQQKGWKTKQQRGSVQGHQNDLDEDFMYDEVDKFARSKDFLSLEPSLYKKQRRSSAVDSSDDQEEVMGLRGIGQQSNEDEQDSDQDEEQSSDEGFDDYEKDLSAGGKLSKLAQLEKKLSHKVKSKQIGEFEDVSEEDEEDDYTGWGKRKKDYYAQQDAEDDDEQLQLLEDEARRIQKQNLKDLDEADLGLDEQEETDSDDEEDQQPKLGKNQTLEEKAQQYENGSMQVESVEADFSGVTEEEKLAAVQRDAPELIVLLKDLSQCLEEVRSKVGPLFAEVQQGKLATEDGISYLEAKHLLLLSYCINIVFYLLLKSEGRSVRDHPVVENLVRIRAYLERIRPLDKKLQHQVDRLLRAAQLAQSQDVAENGDIDEDDPHFLAPNPDNLVSKLHSKSSQQVDENVEEEEGALYVPPKLNPLAMEQEGVGKSRKQRYDELMQRRRAAQSDTLQVISRELKGAPEEIGTSGTEAIGIGGGSVAANLQLLAQRRKLEAREELEEEAMTRVPLSKDEKKKLKAAKLAGRNTLAAFDDFADEVNDLISASKSDPKLSKPSARQIPPSQDKTGDDDIPLREPLENRRQKFDAARQKHQRSFEQGTKRGADEFDELDEQQQFIEQDQQPKKKKKKLQKETIVTQTLPPLEDPTTEGARRINRAIQKNQGLTPFRKKDLKNPRKKNRLSHQKALKRRSGQVLNMRSQDTPYEGEKSGIKSNVVRGRKLT